jgi:2-keto-4-pentenoate hydratase/2-oxohepta-3-ene-1,7-dioic acid hydratase in catechol pathway
MDFQSSSVTRTVVSMKLVMFRRGPGPARPGVLADAEVIDLAACAPHLPPSLDQILAQGVLGQAVEAAALPTAVRVNDFQLVAPIRQPRKVIGIGLNYRDHAVESGMPIPDEPIVFAKFAASIIGPDEPILLPSLSSEVDYEVELVAVIGREARHVPASRALDYVAGYTIGNDVSARDWQLRKPGGQWLLGKSFATFAPIGPALVTRDELPNPHALPIGLKLNGEPMQDSNTNQLIFRIDQLIAYLSRLFPLEPGDLIFTGTPPGVGFARKPPVFLKDGDVCEAWIEGLGSLRNPCRASDP